MTQTAKLKVPNNFGLPTVAISEHGETVVAGSPGATIGTNQFQGAVYASATENRSELLLQCCPRLWNASSKRLVYLCNNLNFLFEKFLVDGLLGGHKDVDVDGALSNNVNKTLQ
jgi:hypothetical protein